MEEELVLGYGNFVGVLGGKHYSVGTLFEGGFELVFLVKHNGCMALKSYQRYNVCGLRLELMRELFIVGYQVGYIDVAIVLLHQDILSDLISRMSHQYIFLAHEVHCIPVDEGIV